MATVLIAWDGSEHAEHAVRVAARELSQRTAVILHVSQSAVDWALAPVLGPMLRMPDVDEAILERANETAEAGAKAAAAHGFEATWRVETSGRAAWHTIIDVAEEIGATMIVAGSHGHSPITAGLLGSSASGLVQRSRVPVLVVPAPEH
jgi:nucleotide-binding universal stress UspA family protein